MREFLSVLLINALHIAILRKFGEKSIPRKKKKNTGIALYNPANYTSSFTRPLSPSTRITNSNCNPRKLQERPRSNRLPRVTGSGESEFGVAFCRKICWSFRKRYPTGQYRSPPARPVTSNSAKRAFAYSGFLRATDIVQPTLSSWPTRYTRDAHVGEFTRAPVSGRPVIQIIFCGLVGVRACACAFAAARACGRTVNWNRRTGRMAPMSKGVLNPFLRPDNRRGSDSGRFDSIKGVVTIACSVKVACKRLFLPFLSLLSRFLIRVSEETNGSSTLYLFLYHIFMRILG